MPLYAHGTVGLPLFIDSRHHLLSAVCQAFGISLLLLKKIQHSVVYEIAIFKGQKMVKCSQLCMVQPYIVAPPFEY